MANAKKKAKPARKRQASTGPTANTEARKSIHPHVDIDVPNVTPKTKLSALTVAQLVDILVQVHTQLPSQRGTPNPRLISEAISRVHDIIAKPDEAFRRAQSAIAKELPKVLREGPYAPLDGGPSPFVKPETKRPG